MAGLTVQNFLSAATGIALAVAVTRAFARSDAKTIGNFWVDLTRATIYVLLPLSIIVALAYVAPRRAANIAGLGRGDDARRRQAGDRARARSPARKRSSSSAPMAAASSTPMPRIPSRIRMPGRITCRSSPCCWFPPPCPSCSAAWSATCARAGRCSSSCSCCSSPAPCAVYWAEAHGNPLLTQFGIDPAVRQYGRQGAPLRPCHVRPLCGGHDRPFLRRRQCDACLASRRLAVSSRCS